MADQRLRREHRVRRQVEFDRVHQSNAYAADDVLVVKGCENDLDYSRLGLSVSRKVGGAVVRNRWKRLIREAFRLNRPELTAGVDFVVRPRRGAACEFHAIQRSLPRLIARVAQRLRRNAE